jgi:TonB family protein
MTEHRKWEGQVVDGRFPLLQYLGGGERSAVYATATEDTALPKAAIKLVEADPDDADSRIARWESAARLSHPHLLRLFHAGRCQLDGRELLYVVMERADEDLSQVLLDRPLAPAEVLDAIEPALDALAYLHAQGFAHGRVRPSNILAVGDKLKLSSDRLCYAGQLQIPREGPDIYSAPETSGAGIAAAGDVWSLGVTVVEALTQRPKLAPPQGLQAPLSDVLGGCLARDLRRRWTVEQIQARLRPAGEPPRRGTLWRYAALAAALVVLGAIVVIPKVVRQEPAAATPQPAVEAAPAPVPAPAASDVSSGVLQQVLPNVPAKASNTIHGRIKIGVKVRVDSSGNVEDAELASAPSSRYFGGLALDAARRWRFSPGGASDWLLRFEFSREAVKARPERARR